jgi:hypothetical protein
VCRWLAKRTGREAELDRLFGGSFCGGTQRFCGAVTAGMLRRWLRCGGCPAELDRLLALFEDEDSPPPPRGTRARLHRWLPLARRWSRRGPVPHPRLLALLAGELGALTLALLAADHRPVDDLTPDDPGDKCARILLAAPAAPPSLVAIAGTTG